MPGRTSADVTTEFGGVAPGAERSGYLLRLYIAGASTRSARAIRNIRRICETHLAGHYSLDVVDLYQKPALARENQVIAAPTLVKREPGPLRWLVGDMSDEGRILAGLGLSVGAGGGGAAP